MSITRCHLGLSCDHGNQSRTRQWYQVYGNDSSYWASCWRLGDPRPVFQWLFPPPSASGLGRCWSIEGKGWLKMGLYDTAPMRLSSVVGWDLAEMKLFGGVIWKCGVTWKCDVIHALYTSPINPSISPRWTLVKLYFSLPLVVRHQQQKCTRYWGSLCCGRA